MDLSLATRFPVWKPKNLPPSSRIRVLEHCGLAHFEIMSQWRLLNTLDVKSLRDVARELQASENIERSWARLLPKFRQRDKQHALAGNLCC